MPGPSSMTLTVFRLSRPVQFLAPPHNSDKKRWTKYSKRQLSVEPSDPSSRHRWAKEPMLSSTDSPRGLSDNKAGKLPPRCGRWGRVVAKRVLYYSRVIPGTLLGNQGEQEATLVSAQPGGSRSSSRRRALRPLGMGRGRPGEAIRETGAISPRRAQRAPPTAEPSQLPSF